MDAVSLHREVLGVAASRGYRLTDVKVDFDMMAQECVVRYRREDGLTTGRFIAPNSAERRMEVYISEFPSKAGTVFIRGAKSEIAQEFAKLTASEAVERGEQMPDDGERYLFCAGLIRQKPIAEQSEAEIAETFMVNAASVIRECDRLLSVNPRARICIIGSESGFKWSFDAAYAASKAALHKYVETKRLPFPDQQIVGVAPTHILNTGMCNRRNADGVEAMEKRRLEHQKQRWLQPIEVARLAHYLLCVDEGYLTNIVIRMNGGQNL